MNALVGERGLQNRDKLPQLVIDRKSQPLCSSKDLDIKFQLKEQRHHSVHASLYSSDESDSDMDPRLKRGRGGRRRRSRQNQRAPTASISSAKQQQQTTSHKEEGVKVHMHTGIYTDVVVKFNVVCVDWLFISQIPSPWARDWQQRTPASLRMRRMRTRKRGDILLTQHLLRFAIT